MGGTALPPHVYANQVPAGSFLGQKRVPGALELELLVPFGHRWVLVTTEPGFSEEQQVLLTTESSLHLSFNVFKIKFFNFFVWCCLP